MLLKTLIITLFLFNISAVFAAPERFFVFDNPWVLIVDLDGYEIQKNDYNHETKHRKIFAPGANGFTFSLFIEPSSTARSSKACREFYLNRLRQAPYERQNEKLYEIGEMAMYHQDVKEFQGNEINQKSYNAYLYKDELCIDVHISKVQYQSEDDAALQRTIKSIKFAPKNSRDYFGAGSFMYVNKNYEGASNYYGKALELEKKKRNLSGELFYALVDNLGISLAYAGKLDKAKEVFIYGTKTEPKYAPFHYNLACALAEEGDVQGAAQTLRKALDLASAQGTKLSDYRTDSSFQKIKDSAEFKKILNP